MVDCHHAQENRDRSQCRRSCSAQGDRGGPQQHVWAGAVHPGHCRGLRHRRGDAPGGRVEAQRVALAGALHDRPTASTVCCMTKRARAACSRCPRPWSRAVVTRTLHAAPPGEVTHWTAPAMAAASGLGVSSVQRIWQAHGLRAHQVRRFNASCRRRDAQVGRTVGEGVQLC